MKISFKILILIISILVIFSGVSIAQKKQEPDSSKKTAFLRVFPKIPLAQEKQDRKPELDSLKGAINGVFFQRTKKYEPDSVGIYAFNFKLEISENGLNQTKITRMTVNDNLAYKVFPFYTELYFINYKALLRARKKITLIIPVLIINAVEKIRYKSEDGSPLIDINAAVNAAYALSSTAAYNNKSEAKQSLDNRYDALQLQEGFEDAITLSPYIFEIYQEYIK